MALDQNNPYEKVISGAFDSPARNDATVNKLLEGVEVQLSKALDYYLFSAELVTEPVPEEVDEQDPISGKIVKVKRTVNKERWKHLPTEEMIVGCRSYGINCHEKNFMPDPTQAYSNSIDPDIFEGYCTIFTEDRENKYVSRLQALKTHMETHIQPINQTDIEFLNTYLNNNNISHTEDLNVMDADNALAEIAERELPKNDYTLKLLKTIKQNKMIKAASLDSLAYNSKWLSWNPKFTRAGFLYTKNYIMVKVSTLHSTTIVQDKKNRFGMDTDELMIEEAITAAQRNIHNILLNHREYVHGGLPLTPTDELELMDLEYELFLAAKRRSLNGIFLRGIISNIEERKVNITNETVGTKQEGGSSVFNIVRNRGQ